MHSCCPGESSSNGCLLKHFEHANKAAAAAAAAAAAGTDAVRAAVDMMEKGKTTQPVVDG